MGDNLQAGKPSCHPTTQLHHPSEGRSSEYWPIVIATAKEEYGKSCTAAGTATRTAGILTKMVKGTG